MYKKNCHHFRNSAILGAGVISDDLSWYSKSNNNFINIMYILIDAVDYAAVSDQIWSS